MCVRAPDVFKLRTLIATYGRGSGYAFSEGCPSVPCHAKVARGWLKSPNAASEVALSRETARHLPRATFASDFEIAGG